MKARRRLRSLPLLVISASFAAAASNQYWNVASTGGDGIWGTGPGDKNWNLTAGAAVGNTTWSDSSNDVAVFQDALGGNVTVFDPVQTNGLSQTGANYTIDAGVITLVPDAATAAPFVHVQTGTLTLNTPLAGSNGLLKTGNGTLLLANSNTYTGTTSIDAGTLDLTGSLASTDVRIASGGSLIDATGGLGTTTALTNAGTLTINAADTIASLTNTADTLNGIGTLTVTGATIFTGGTLAAPLTLNGPGGGTFTNATLAGTFNGTTALDGGTVSGTVNGNTTSNGNLLVSGSLGGGSLDLNGGILTLTGTSTNATITLAAGAGLGDQSGGLDAATNLTNAGTLTVSAADTIATYTQHGSGSLTGTGVLTATGGATLHGGTISGNLNGNTTSTGDVLVSGNLDGGSLHVNSGILNLTGSATNTPINIATGAALIDASGGLDSTAILTNAGTLTINAADTIATYIQSNTGSLTGTGILTTGGATLNGGTISGMLNGNTTSTGDVLVSGTLDGGTLDVTGGTLTLTGRTYQHPISISPLARLLVEGNGLAFASAVTNDGILTFNGENTILSYTQNGAGSLDGTGTLKARSGSILNGGTVAGNLRGTTTTTGDILVSGTLGGGGPGFFGGGGLHVNAGTLNLTGTADTVPVTIARGATLIDANGGLNSWAMLINDGVLTVNAAETITSYRSNGGALTGVGSLTTAVAYLQPDSLVSLSLKTDTLTTNGNVAINSSVTARDIQINSGILTNIGSLASSSMNIETGATLVASGSQQYNLLTTSGPGTGIWQGDLTNPTTLAPGGVGGIGSLRVTGNFTNAPTGTLALDVSAAGSDLLKADGTATFGGMLDLNQFSPITPFVPVQVVAAGAYAGNFTTLTENLDGTAWFNPGNGTVMTLAPPTAASGSTLYGSTANQTAVWTSLYDDVIDPGFSNITLGADGKPIITSGIADANNPDLLNALSASFGPSGLNAAVLDRLSPEVYAGFQDYAVQATRTHQRTALDAPALGFIQAPRSPHSAGSKTALPAPSAANPWEYFAAVDYFNAETDSSANRADYGISGFGFVAGARTALSNSVRVGGYVAADDGTVEGALIDGDASGWSLGLFAKALVHAGSHTLITSGLSYGSYSFDGTRSSLIATGGGWTPAGVGFSGVDSDALEFYLGASSIAFQTERFRLIPAMGLRYVCGNMVGFTETTGAPGSPIALAVDGDSYQSTIAELSLRAEADLTASITAHCLLGFSTGINDDSTALTARFANGSRMLRATASGLDEDALFIGLGTTWRVRDNVGLGLNWRADFRSDADMENTVGLSTSIQF